MDVFLLVLLGKPRLFVQHREIGDDGGQRRFEVMGQKDHEVIFSLLTLHGLVLPALQRHFQGVELLGNGPQFRLQRHRSLGIT